MLRVLVGRMALHVLPAALLLGRPRAAPDAGPATPAAMGDRIGVLAVFRTREVLQMLAMFSLAGMSFSAIQVHHVPAMEAGGISLGVATTIASVRGLLSLPGRALIDPVVRRVGLPLALGATYCVMAAGTFPLAVGGSLLWPLVFMLGTGLVFGTISPLQGLYATEVFGLDRIGTLMGVQTLVVSLVSALGPALLGVMVDATGGYALAIVLASALSLGAFVLLALRPRAPHSRFGEPAAGGR